MKAHPVFRVLWCGANALLLVSLIAFAYGLVWEYKTRQYLQGFADAIAPLDASPGERVEAILQWLQSAPPRHPDGETVSLRDPQNTLNYQHLLRVCSTATNAFINLAVSRDVPARRLLLLDANHEAKHVVAEVRLENRWVVVDPLYRVVLRDAQGRLLTKEQLRDATIFEQATRGIPDYRPEYTYDSTTHVRLARIRVVGLSTWRMLDRLVPGWGSSVYSSLVLERPSLALTVVMGLLLAACLVLLFVLGWYGRRRLQVSLLLRD